MLRANDDKVSRVGKSGTNNAEFSAASQPFRFTREFLATRLPLRFILASSLLVFASVSRRTDYGRVAVLLLSPDAPQTVDNRLV